MLPRLDIAAVAPVTPGSAVAAVGDGRQAALQRALQNLVGQTVSAEVLSRLQDGSYLVKVVDYPVRMQLAGDTAVGSQLPLTVLSAQPRPTFQLANAAPGSAPPLVYSEAGDSAPPLPSQGSNVLVSGQARPGGASQPPASGQPASAGQPAADHAADALPLPSRAGHQPAAPTPALPAGAPPAETARPDTMLAGRAALAGAATAGDPRGAATAAPAAAAQGAPAEGARPSSLAATLLGKAPLTPAHELPELGPDAPQATLSSAARLLTNVLSAAQGSQAAQVALVGKSALFGQSAPDTETLAQTLRDTIATSGLFYESHVAEWARGERPLSELAREPQMQRLLQQGADTAARAAGNGPDLSAAHLINQQLHTQEQQRVLWHGQTWPGQDMQWEVRRDAREQGRQGHGDSDAEPEPMWRSGVRFRLPTLGTVAAAVTLIGDQVHIQVQTDSDHSAATLRAYASRLESAMAAAGAPLSSLNISQEDGHDG